LETVPYDFAVYLRDRWSNYSDTVTSSVTPWFEEFIPKTGWTEITLPDSPTPDMFVSNYYLARIWDGQYGPYSLHTLENTPLPQIFTWDLTKTVSLSRFKLWPRTGATDAADDRWKRGHPREFEFYGSTQYPEGNETDVWLPLGRFECVKPSPGTQITQEDIAFADEGIDFDFEVFPEVRYIRLKVLTTFFDAPLFSTVDISEISFWGKVLD
jgi:hypothetical protein